MPEPNRAPWRISDDLKDWHVWQLIEAGATLVFQCDACPHEARWPPAEIARRLGRHRGRTMIWLGPRLKCSACRSCWMRISPEFPCGCAPRPGFWP